MDTQYAIMNAFNFRERDLEMNRAGNTSEEQIRRALMKKAYDNILQAVIIIVVVGIIAYIFLNNPVNSTGVTVVIAGFIGVVVAGGFYGLRLWNIWQARGNATIETRRSNIYLREDRRTSWDDDGSIDVDVRFYMRILEQEIGITDQQFHALQPYEGRTFLLYYLQPGEILLSLELVNYDTD